MALCPVKIGSGVDHRLESENGGEMSPSIRSPRGEEGGREGGREGGHENKGKRDP